MKKLFLGTLLGLASFVASAQQFNQIPFLACQSLSVSNTAGYTNNQAYYGWSALTQTNTTGLRYTNSAGSYILVAATNTTTSIIAVSNGVAFSTHDQQNLAFDVRFHSDRNGNVVTNYVLSMAALYNATSTGALACIFAPIIGNDNPSAANPGVVLLDLNNTISAQFLVARAGATNCVLSIDWSKYSGYKGLRLISAGLTNSLGQAWIQDLSLDTYVP